MSSPDNDLNMETELHLLLSKYMIGIPQCSNFENNLCKLFLPYQKVTCSSQAFCSWKKEFLKTKKKRNM